MTAAETASAGPVPATPPAEGPPPELSARLPRWLRQAREAAAQLDAPALVEEVLNLQRQWRRPGFRVAVVGEFNRGKSTVVNRLVGRDVLPTGPVPTTRGTVVVRHGVEDSLLVAESLGSSRRHSLEPASWADLFVGDGGATGPVPQLEVELPCAWLDDLDTELVDTGGTNDAPEAMAEVRRAVARCDAAVMLVSATSPLSLSEQHLLEVEVLRRAVPFVLVVVSFLDRVAVEDREQALDDVRRRVRALAPQAAVLPGSGPRGDDEALEALRAAIADCAARSENRAYRDRKVATGVAEVAAAVADVARTAVEVRDLDVEERRRRLSAAREAVRREQPQWEDLRVELEGRRLALARDIRGHLVAEEERLLETLHWELQRASDPKAFWDRDVPYKLARELAALTRKAEGAVLSGIGADLDWLDGVIAERFVEGALTRPSATIAPVDPHAPHGAGEVIDLGRRRVLTRLGAPAGTVLGYVLGAAASVVVPPIMIAVAAGAAGGLTAELTLRDAVREQRRVVERYLARGVPELFAALGDQVQDAIGQLYDEVLSELAQRREAWRESRLAALSSPDCADDGSVHKVLAEATALTEEIRDALGARPTPPGDHA